MGAWVWGWAQVPGLRVTLAVRDTCACGRGAWGRGAQSAENGQTLTMRMWLPWRSLRWASAAAEVIHLLCRAQCG